MVERNPDIANLPANYLFVDIAKRKAAFLQEEPDAKLISLGIGDTTEPLPAPVVQGLVKSVEALGTAEGYSGYESGPGKPALRQAIASRIYHNRVTPDEIFISDGSKCDIGRFQILFGRNCRLALQDPAYPAYIASSLMAGKQGIIRLPCTITNRFFPDLSPAKAANLIFFCSPNNPTGEVATRAQLEELVAHAKKQRSIIVFDTAYAEYIQDPAIPKSIFEIPGAREVALETSSFSKMVGFTGVRLGWTVVPKELRFDDGTPVAQDWAQVMSTYFNGASNIVQSGGVAALSDDGWKETKRLVGFYLENARLLRHALEECGLSCYGGVHAPFLWVKLKQMKSWEAFDWLMRKAHIVTTPGVGFGPSGEGFLRLSAFGHRDTIMEAARRLKKVF